MSVLPSSPPGSADEPITFLEFDGEMAARMRAYNWAASPLGAPSQWPQGLRTAVRIMLTSRYAMWMAWGEELTFFCNDAYLPTVGIKRDWVLGTRSDKVWAEIWPDIGPRIERVLTTGQATWDEALLLFLERSGFPEETYHTFSYSPLADDVGRTTGMLCVVTEETERVIGARRLAALRELAAGIAASRSEKGVLEATRATLSHADRDLTFGLVYLFGAEGELRLASATGLEASDGFAPALIEPSSPWWSALNAAQSGQHLLDLRNEFAERPSSSWGRPVDHAALVPIIGQGLEKPMGFLIAGVSPHRPFDASYKGFIDLFAGQISAGLANARSYEEERRRAEALAALDQAKTLFFSNVSHEFRTPLTLMMSPIEEALARADAELGPDMRSLLEMAQRNSARLLRLVNNLLDFTRIEAGRAQARYEAVDVAALTAELASNFRSATEKAGLSLIIDCPPLAEPVYLDHDMWEKIVLNLVSNAFKFTFAGHIAIRLHPAQGKRAFVLTVEDTGVGMPEDELPRLFERFHRVQGQRSRSFEGSGIGLALVNELVKLHGGEITVESVPDQGTRFHISIPFGSAHLPAEQIASTVSTPAISRHASTFVQEAARWLPGTDSKDLAREPENEASVVMTHRGRQARILIVDDNADMREYLCRLLAGWETMAVSDGLSALDAMRSFRPDILLSDVMMPGLDGFGLLKAVRADPTIRDIPVILLSARAGEEARVEGLGAGADDYLTKPFSAKELRARVQANLDLARMRGEATKTLRVSQARSDLLVTLSDRLRDLKDVNEIQLAVTETLGTFLDAARCGYCEIDDEAAHGTVTIDWTNGTMPSARGRYRLEDYESAIIAQLRTGKADLCNDIREDPRIGPERLPAYEALGGMRAALSVPLFRDGRWVALLYVHDNKPREWTPDDEVLAREVAERLFVAVERARAESALVRSEARLRAIYDLALDGLFVFRAVRDDRFRIRDFVYESINPAGARLLATTVEALKGQSLLGLWPSHSASGGLFDRYVRVVETGLPHDFEFLYEGEGFKGWYRNAAVKLGDGLIVQLADVTHRHRAEEQRTLLINELNHRVKNSLATVQSIASQTLRGAKVEPSVRQTLEARLFSLASAHDVLTQQNWERAFLGDIVHKALSPFRSHEHRFDISGPEVQLSPKSALAIAMALHELATNAVKYGALSNAEGRVSITWSVQAGTTPSFLLTWAEQGGPPVEEPQRKGFGSRLIERGLAGELGGEATIEYNSTGIICSFRAPLANEGFQRAPIHSGAGTSNQERMA